MSDHDAIETEVREIGKDIISTRRFKKAAKTRHHKNVSVASHSIATACCALEFSRWLNDHGVKVNPREAVRASLLHDIGMTEDPVFQSPSYRKAYSHPREGIRIAKEEYHATDEELDAISRHMWPICILPPTSVAGWVVVAADKYCSMQEAKRYLQKKNKEK